MLALPAVTLSHWSTCRVLCTLSHMMATECYFDSQ